MGEVWGVPHPPSLTYFSLSKNLQYLIRVATILGESGNSGEIREFFSIMENQGEMRDFLENQGK